jgi:hypothetical protein
MLYCMQSRLKSYVELLTNVELDTIIKSKGLKPPSNKLAKVDCLVSVVMADAGNVSH